jgi:hypothetical protein
MKRAESPANLAAIGSVAGAHPLGSPHKPSSSLPTPAPTRKKGLSDRVLLGCGLRRGEFGGWSLLTWRKCEGHWLIVDLVGKQGRVRTVSMPSWAKAVLDG